MKRLVIIGLLIAVMVLVSCKVPDKPQPDTIKLVTRADPMRMTHGTPLQPPAEVGKQFTYSFCSSVTKKTDICGEESINPTGGKPPYHFQLDSGYGFPPTGLTLNQNGLLQGTPQAKGTSQFRVCAVDLKADQVCQTITLEVKPPEDDFSGRWSGTATQTDAACDFEGTMAMVLKRVGNDVTGTIDLDLGLKKTKIEGFCVPRRAATSALSGTIDGDHLTFQLPDSTFTGEGDLTGNKIVGTTSVESAGVLTTGVFTVTKE